MKNGIENFNSSTNDGNLIVQHPMLILLVYEVLMCNKLKHIVKELVMHPSRCTSSTANCDLIRFVSKLAVFDSSVFSLLEPLSSLHTLTCLTKLTLLSEIDSNHTVNNEAAYIQYTRFNTSYYTHTLDRLHHCIGSITQSERNEIECSVVEVPLGLKTLRGTSCR